MIKNKIKHVDMMLLIIILIASTLSTRSTDSFKKIEIAINFIMILYIIIRLVLKKPIKIIQSKLDVFVILLVISTIIPIVTNTYISLYTTVETLLNYMTMIWIYLLAREVCLSNENNIKYIKNILIIFVIILIFIGIENISSNKIFELLDINIVKNGETRLVSVFGNPNVFSSLIMLSFFISINEMINADSVSKKLIYGTCNTIFIMGIILTYSKLTYLVFPFMLLVYLLQEKDKSKRIYIIQNAVMSLIYALLYTYILQKLLNYQYYIEIWIFTTIWIMVVAFSNKLITKTAKYFEKINIKKVIIVILIIIVLGSVWISFELQNGKEFVAFNENTISDYNAKIIKNINPNENYIFSFDMEAKVLSEQYVKDMFTIKIIQRGSRGLDEITSEEYSFDNFSGVKQIEICTTSNTSEIKIEFKTKSKSIPKYWVINKLLLNNKEVILEYKHLPTKLIEKIKDINIQYKTAQVRLDFIKDGFKLISQNFLTGIGGGGWFHKYGEVQERDYIAIDPHNYYIQIWIEFGIIGLVSIIAITYIVLTLKYTDEKDKWKYKGVQIAILAVLLHSMLDLDMYFPSIRLIIFLCLGVLGNILKKKENTNGKYITNVILLIIAIGTMTINLNKEIYEKDLIISKLEKAIINLDTNSSEYKEYNRKILEQSNKILKYEKSYSSIVQYERKKVEACVNSGGEDIENILQHYYESMLLLKNEWLYNEEKIIEKSTAITTIISKLEEENNSKYYDWMKKLAKINIDEFKETEKCLLNVLDQKYKEKDEEIHYLMLLRNYNYAIQIINKN